MEKPPNVLTCSYPLRPSSPAVVDELRRYTPMNDIIRCPLPLRAGPHTSACNCAVDVQNPGGEFWTSTAEPTDFLQGRPAAQNPGGVLAQLDGSCQNRRLKFQKSEPKLAPTRIFLGNYQHRGD